MEVELQPGRAVVSAAEERSFDPRRIPRAVREAGFEAGEIELTAVGVVVMEDELLILRLSSAPRELRLEDGETIDELRQRGEADGGRVRVRGRFRHSDGDGPPTLAVEHWEVVPAAAGEDDAPD